MSDKMTGVYSGGLMYEYALEENGYGIAKIPSAKASAVQEQDGFAKFASALKANPAPTGDGGFTSTTHSVACPTKDSDWLVDSTLLPAIPAAAQKMMSDGAGKGPGLKGDGSQNAGGGDSESTGDATPGSGTVSETGKPSSSKNAAAGRVGGPGSVEKAPFVVAGLVAVLTLTGTLLL